MHSIANVFTGLSVTVPGNIFLLFVYSIHIYNCIRYTNAESKKMGRRRKYSFKDPKMFSSRVEREDYYLVEKKMHKDMITLQDFINTVIKEYISGTIYFSGSEMCFKENE